MESWPRDFSSARVFLISKIESAFPKANETRVISLLNCLYKIVELIVLEKLNEEIEQKGLLNKAQTGFVKGLSCSYNLARLTDIFEKA